MSAQGHQPKKIPPTFGAKGNVEGKIGEHAFQTSIADVSNDEDNNIIRVTAIHRDDDGSSENIEFVFSYALNLEEKLDLENNNKVQVWVSFPNESRTYPYEKGTLFLEEFSIKPFRVKGYVWGTTGRQGPSLNVTFELSR